MHAAAAYKSSVTELSKSGRLEEASRGAVEPPVLQFLNHLPLALWEQAELSTGMG